MCNRYQKKRIIRIICAMLLLCANVRVAAQVNSLSELFKNHVRAEATDAQDGPKVQTRFEFTAVDSLVTQGVMNFNNSGYEDRIVVGFAQTLGAAKTRLSYNLQHLYYNNDEKQSGEMTYDFNYRKLHVLHRVDKTQESSTVGLPLDINALHVDISFSHVQLNNFPESIDVFKLDSRTPRLKFSASMTDSGNATLVSISSDYRLSHTWLIKLHYVNTGEELQRQIRSEYATDGFRFTGEYRSQTDKENQTYITSSIGIEKDTHLASLQLRLEYQGITNSPVFFFKVQSNVSF